MSRLPGPAPRRLVVQECLRALGEGLLLPARVLRYVAAHRRLVGEVRRDLAAPAGVEEPLPDDFPAGRRLHVFVSCAEPSGETHAVNLVRELRAALSEVGAPAPRLSGLGGEALAAEEVELVGNPVENAAMGSDVLHSLPFWLRLVERTADFLRREEVDLFLPVDSPALHVPLARIARSYGIPVCHFATPQYWAWAPWRVAAYRRAVDLGLTILPFEPPWFARHGVRTAHVGHPLLDEVRPGAPRDGEGGTLLLLPGSRESVVERNLPWMLDAAERLLDEAPELELVIAHTRRDQERRIRTHVERSAIRHRIRLALGDLETELGLARAALSVSGTILIDLLLHRVPAVVLYRLASPLQARLAPRALTVPWFSSVNLLAGREVYPEFAFHGTGPVGEVGAALARCYKDEAWRAECRAGLEEAARRLGPPGACRRAARLALANVRRNP